MEREYCCILCKVSFHHSAYDGAGKYLQLNFGEKEVNDFD